MQPILELSYTLDTIDAAALQFWQQLSKYRIFAFNAEMGAGKTTFIHHLCNLLGVTDAVSSPTFALINEYHFEQAGTDKVIFHMDWYRLKNGEEAVNAGMEDCLLQPDVYCFVEWPGIAADLLPIPFVAVDISITGPASRTMRASLINDRSQVLF